MNEIAYIENGIAYVFEDQLPLCGCGGKPKVLFNDNGRKFTSFQIYCGKCGMTTDVCDSAKKAINKWMKCFGDLERLKEDAAAYESEHWDDCLSFAGKCKYD